MGCSAAHQCWLPARLHHFHLPSQPPHHPCTRWLRFELGGLTSTKRQRWHRPRFQWARRSPRLLAAACRSIVARLAIPASARDPMPITLRNVRPDAAAKLRQLESGAAALDRAARDLIPEELRHRLRPRRPLRVTIKARAYLRYLRAAGHAAESSLASLARTAPHIAAGFRFLRGLLADAVFCISLSGAVLVALALAIMLVAPPA